MNTTLKNFLIALALSLACLLLATCSAVVFRGSLSLSTALQSILTFLLPVVLFAFCTKRNVVSYLKADKFPSIKKFLIFFGIFVILSYLLTFVEKWNMSWHLPEKFADLEITLRSIETMANDGIMRILGDGKNVFDIIRAIVVVALLPAICEEAFFRGGLLGGMLNSHTNKHIAVWVSAFIFSFIHFQFFGFMPRFIIGAFLGYCFVYTKSIWTSVCFHFLNNFAAVMIMYYFPEMM